MKDSVLKTLFLSQFVRSGRTRRLLCHLFGILTLWVWHFDRVSAAASGNVPSPEIIARYRDTSIQVFGSYAAVKLPITRGMVLWNPTAVGCAPDGTIFAANYTGEIYRLIDADGDGLEDTALPFADVRKDGLKYPTSLAFRGRQVFVGTASTVRVYEDSDGDGMADRSFSFFEGIPCSGHTFDWTFGLCFGPDGWLHLALSTDSYNPKPAADPEGWRGSILRVSPDGRNVERFATGLRFPYGMGFNERGDLFFTDNRGGENATEEINFAERGRFYGQHPEKFLNHPPVTPPIVQVQYGYGMAGMTFNSTTNDFGGTAGDLFAACWGPDYLWDRGSIIRVRTTIQPDGSYRAREFLFARETPKISSVTFGRNGDLYVAQFGRETIGHTPLDHPTGAFYRFIPVPGIIPSRPQEKFPVIAGNREHGAILFRDRGCVSCHAIGGEVDMLGPDLGGVGEMMSEEEIVAAIEHPSEGIKSGYETEMLVLRSGETLTGRMIAAEPRQITLLVAGNQRVPVLQSEILRHQHLTNSMMPEGLLTGLTTADRRDLLAFLGVRDRQPHGVELAWIKIKSEARRIRASTNRSVKVVVFTGICLAALGVAVGLMIRISKRV